MTCQTQSSSVCGIIRSNTQLGGIVAPLRGRQPAPLLATNPLERLVEIMNGNERLMEELARSRERIVKARAYLDEPGCHARFGRAHLDRCQVRHSGILAQLRANRIEALSILATGEPTA